MVTVKYVGERRVVLGDKFIYPGETREVSELVFEKANKAHPGWFKVMDEVAPADAEAKGEVKLPGPIIPDSLKADQESEPLAETVTDADESEHVDQPVAGRRSRAKQHSK